MMTFVTIFGAKSVKVSLLKNTDYSKFNNGYAAIKFTNLLTRRKQYFSI